RHHARRARDRVVLPCRRCYCSRAPRLTRRSRRRARRYRPGRTRGLPNATAAVGQKPAPGRWHDPAESRRSVGPPNGATPRRTGAAVTTMSATIPHTTTGIAARAEHATKVYGGDDTSVRALDDVSVAIDR